ncbi:glycosyltransferase [Caulobacter sp. BE254]|uniref:glycosyltransferase family 32 protein n=1 Tax=Caulobacter sp. BE254 TaxID=2817720 RepID=UPI002865C78D|nr:glycosyltransferase [Caulobacter sp. BE254]MDR7117304.1 mannosyltransferase OCH1-like enzyme [Caulobacter sp. BE254]
MKNPKILHRVYFDDMPPYKDPFGRYLDTWKREMPDYKIMYWNASSVDLEVNEWVRRARKNNSPVFLSEYFRWKALSEYGGMYLDADCEILDGRKLHALIEDVYASKDYDAALGVEDFYNGHPTAQTVIAKPDAELVKFMMHMYEETLSGPLWHWREERGLIGPQLISLYFRDRGMVETKGMLTQIYKPTVESRVKIYPQEYFSPKFEVDGTEIRHTSNTCVYHLFANLNMQWDDETRIALRENPMLYAEYIDFLKKKKNTAEHELDISLGLPIKTPPKKTHKPGALKILHRIYFGFDGQPDSCAGYLETWREQLPEYEIKQWDATNLPMDINDYVRELHAAKDHAFLTDFFRWWVLKEYGGIYLDADVEIVDGDLFDKLIDELEEADSFDAFIGIDEKTGGWYTAHSMAAKKNSDIANFMCSVYEGLGPIKSWRKKAFYLWAPQLTALYFFENDHHVDGMGTTPHIDKPIVAGRVKIYPQEYFSPIAPGGKPGELFSINAFNENTSLCHHFACSWHDSASPYSTHAQGFSAKQNKRLIEVARAAALAGQVDVAAAAAPTDLETRALRTFAARTRKLRLALASRSPALKWMVRR